jgi:transposase
MRKVFDVPLYPYRRCADQDAASPARHPVVVVGAGPVGLAAAIDLALNNVPVVLVDDNEKVSSGSRAICFAKRQLEIFDRLGCGDVMVEKGVVWSLGKVFFQERQVFAFNLLPEGGHKRPAFINLQQYYLEQFLVERVRELQAQGKPIAGGSRTEAAEIAGVTLQIIRDWVVKFNASGPEGLIDRKAPGRAALLSEEHRKALAGMIESGPTPAVHGVVRWRIVDLCQWLFEEFRISVSKQTLSRQLRAMGYRKLSARPRHHGIPSA